MVHCSQRDGQLANLCLIRAAIVPNVRRYVHVAAASRWLGIAPGFWYELYKNVRTFIKAVLSRLCILKIKLHIFTSGNSRLLVQAESPEGSLTAKPGAARPAMPANFLLLLFFILAGRQLHIPTCCKPLIYSLTSSVTSITSNIKPTTIKAIPSHFINGLLIFFNWVSMNIPPAIGIKPSINEPIVSNIIWV